MAERARSSAMRLTSKMFRHHREIDGREIIAAPHNAQPSEARAVAYQ